MIEIAVGNQLLHFSEDEILLTEEQAKVVYEFFFSNNTRIMTALKNKTSAEGKIALDFMHIEFAQALLVEGLDASYSMGFVASLLGSLVGGKKVPSLQLKAILQRFGKKAGDHWFKHASADDLWDDPEIHGIVQTEIARHFREVAFNLLANNAPTGY